MEVGRLELRRAPEFGRFGLETKSWTRRHNLVSATWGFLRVLGPCLTVPTVGILVFGGYMRDSHIGKSVKLTKGYPNRT